MDSRFHLGIVLIQQKAYPDAITNLEKVHEKKAGAEDLGYFLGLAYFQLGAIRESPWLPGDGKDQEQAF
jgi:hypothetical protein